LVVVRWMWGERVSVCCLLGRAARGQLEKRRRE
jgi:hypothetical protein